MLDRIMVRPLWSHMKDEPYLYVTVFKANI